VYIDHVRRGAIRVDWRLNSRGETNDPMVPHNYGRNEGSRFLG
jgi:hypothetical protein